MRLHARRKWLGDRCCASFAIATCPDAPPHARRRVLRGRVNAASCPVANLDDGTGSDTWAESARRTLMASSGEQQGSRVPVHALQDVLDNVEMVATANKALSWHIHLPSYDKTGKVFWLPV